MAECRLELVAGHLIVDVGGRLLLDTGSPVSFSTTGRANWGGRDPDLPTSALGLDGITAILGTGLFVHFPVLTFDYPAGRLILGHGSPAPSAS